MSLIALLRLHRARKEARRIACEAASRIEPGEPILGSWVLPDEPHRFVVRVFVGHIEQMEHLRPPWKKCLVFTVDKATFKARLEADEKYRPVLR